MSQTPETQSIDLQDLSVITTRPHTFKQNLHRVPPPRRYKTSKQLFTDEQKYLQTKDIKFDTPTWQSIGAPPSLKPNKHYCDITGLEGRYKNPSNGLRFHNVEIYQEVIRNMPPGVDQEYLKLRGANVVLK
ncbi:uncharacterized protein CANTADRAFT_54582 [Suhomyces tanzawaensis NRRL Y-17324]|uniref:Vps72/YL1 C-terminal domain-containing protein n=1 Tax=Suhomyces tanzawaensis NRRL Y-17324 TaxID=984487 RepID=A0A1E4SEV5_9ASCO|nr:uncharacterized protein CANTADRAFT_54582 [Suhomyces tanzawaensis NRRL Y-17324]ODV78010.1 hypothetical protein CANTADRAFT_54582 [Suhomyces tanzawaensis NRRL Y-17324]